MEDLTNKGEALRLNAKWIWDDIDKNHPDPTTVPGYAQGGLEHQSAAADK